MHGESVSEERRADAKAAIESEIGRNGWRLIGKIAVLILVPMFMMGLGGAFAISGWRGEIDTSLANHLQLGGHPSMETRMTALQSKHNVQEERVANLIKTLNRIERGQEELKRILTQRNGWPE